MDDVCRCADCVARRGDALPRGPERYLVELRRPLKGERYLVTEGACYAVPCRTDGHLAVVPVIVGGWTVIGKVDA